MSPVSYTHLDVYKRQVLAGLAGIKVEKWWKFAIPVGVALFLTQAVLMILAVVTGFGM